MKVILGNTELIEVVQKWAASEFGKDASVAIANKKSGVEVTVELLDKISPSQIAKAFPNVEPELVETGCCGAVDKKQEDSE